MKTPSKKEVKEYFKNAKEVKCLADGKTEDYKTNKTHFWNDDYWCGNNLKIWDKEKGYAEIISYKQPKLKISTELLKQLADNNSFSEQLIKKEFPQLFESDKLECNRWVKDKYLDKYLCYFKEDGNRYGFDLYGEWFEDNSTLKPYDDTRNIYATPQEVETAFKLEEEKRGIKQYETSLKNPINGNVFKIEGNYRYFDNQGNYKHMENVIMDSNGKWAEIIETPTDIITIVEEIQQRLDKIKEELNNAK